MGLVVNTEEESPESVSCLYLSSKILPFSTEGKEDRMGRSGREKNLKSHSWLEKDEGGADSVSGSQSGRSPCWTQSTWNLGCLGWWKLRTKGVFREQDINPSKRCSGKNTQFENPGKSNLLPKLDSYLLEMRSSIFLLFWKVSNFSNMWKIWMDLASQVSASNRRTYWKIKDRIKIQGDCVAV